MAPVLSIGDWGCKQFFKSLSDKLKSCFNFFALQDNWALLDFIKEQSFVFFSTMSEILALSPYKISIFFKFSVLYRFQNKMNCVPESCPCKKIGFPNCVTNL